MGTVENIERFLEELLGNVRIENEALRESLSDCVSLTEYDAEDGTWSDSLQKALNEHQTVIIPKSESAYIIDRVITVPANRCIIAEDGAVIRLAEGVKTLMLRNANTVDGTRSPITGTERDRNITVIGGIWEDWCTSRMGYGKSGMYDGDRSFFGVSTYMLFENIDRLTLKNMTFKNCGGFALQIGEAANVIIENICFENCFADGIHVNGNTENLHIKNVYGQVGDDLVALNMYDWQNSSINFGPCKNVLCEDLTLDKNSRYKALRIEPGIYTFDAESRVDCSLINAVFRRIKNIKTFKLYCQTPKYFPYESAETGDVGSGSNIVFKDIKVDLDAPIDLLGEYLDSDPVKGSFAAFELGLNIDNFYLKNVDVRLHKEKYPYSYLLCIGPKAARSSDCREIFDPSFSSTAENIYLDNVTVNGKKIEKDGDFIREIVFDEIYGDMPSSGKGKIKNIILNDGETVL